MKIFTVGFTGKDAKTFFELLKNNGVKILMDVRLNNKSQLAGFTKVRDFPYFLNELCKCEYKHEELFAPTKELLDGYRKGEISWGEYEIVYNQILEERNVISKIDIDKLANSCFLCSESTAEYCHRRLAVEYLKQHIKTLAITHL